MDRKAWLADYRAARIKKPLPVLSFPGTQLLGCTVHDLVTDSRKQADCIAAIAAKYDTAAAVGPMDLSVEAEAFGCKISFSEDEVPTVSEPLLDIDEPEKAEELTVPAVGTARTRVYADAVRLAKESVTDRPLFAGCIGPYSLAGRLIGMADVMIACAEEPEMLETVLARCTEFLTAYILSLRAAGADGIIIAEPAAGLLSPAFNAEFSVPWLQKIVREVQNDSFLVIYHNCGPYTPRQIPDLLKTGASVFHFGDAIDLTQIMDQIPDDKFFAGNVSPSSTFLGGTPDQVREATWNLLESCGSCDRFILSSGCDIPPRTPHENIQAFFETAQRYYTEKR